MQVAIHWQDADSSSANAVREVFPDAEIMICGGHAGENPGIASENENCFKANV